MKAKSDEKTNFEARPVAIPLANAALFKHYTGLSPDRARKLHLSEGFPLRARGAGGRRSWYAIVDEVARWWAKQQGE